MGMGLNSVSQYLISRLIGHRDYHYEVADREKLVLARCF